MVSTPEELMELTNASGFIPEYVLYDMSGPTSDTIQTAREAWGDYFYAVGQQTRAELGQEAVVVKNTFLQVEEKPVLRRNRSFSEFDTSRSFSNPSNIASDTVYIGEGSKHDYMYEGELSSRNGDSTSTRGSCADSCESSVCSGAEDNPPVIGKGSVRTTVRRTATRITKSCNDFFVDTCESSEKSGAENPSPVPKQAADGSTVQQHTIPTRENGSVGSTVQRTKTRIALSCDDSFADSCASSDYSGTEDGIPARGKRSVVTTAVRRTEFDDATFFEDSCFSSIWSNRKPLPLWDPKPKFSGKRRKSGWTRQRHSRVLADEAKMSSSGSSASQTLPATNTTPAPLNYAGYFPNICAAYLVPVCVATPVSNVLQ